MYTIYDGLPRDPITLRRVNALELTEHYYEPTEDVEPLFGWPHRQARRWISPTAVDIWVGDNPKTD